MPKPDPKPIDCPVCGNVYLERRGNHTVCMVCYWEDSCCDGAPLEEGKNDLSSLLEIVDNEEPCLEDLMQNEIDWLREHGLEPIPASVTGGLQVEGRILDA